MAELPTDRAALDEYMGVWFRSEVPDTVEIRSTAMIFCKQLEERIESCRLIIDHLVTLFVLEKCSPCPFWDGSFPASASLDACFLWTSSGFSCGWKVVLLVVTAIVGLSFTTGSISVAVLVLPLPFLGFCILNLRLAGEINALCAGLTAVIDERENFFDELNVLVGRSVPDKMAEFMRGVQDKDILNLMKLQILGREFELRAQEKNLFIEKLKGNMEF
ncbi:hypothetical protein Tco_0545223 [Tanacetum coccineum]